MINQNNIWNTWHKSNIDRKALLQEKTNSRIADITNEDELVNGFFNSTLITKKPKYWLYIREALKKDWINIFSWMDTEHWYASKDARGIVIGWKETPEEMKKIFWLHKSFSKLDVKSYTLSHEMSHHIIFYILNHQESFPDFWNIYNQLKYIRQKTNTWLSKLWNLERYKKRKSSHDEDLTELITKYCIEPLFLKEYLQYLTSSNENELEQNWLFKIPWALADKIYDRISEWVSIYLKEHWIEAPE